MITGKTCYILMTVDKHDDVQLTQAKLVVSHHTADCESENCRANRKISAESARLECGFTICTFAKHLRIA